MIMIIIMIIMVIMIIMNWSSWSSWSSSRLQHGGVSTLAVERRGLHNFTPVCIFHNLKISNIPPYMQIEERPPTRFRPFRENESREKVSSKIFLPLPSVPFDLNPDKESLAKPSNFCQKPRGFKQTAETGRRLLCKLKLPINFEPTHSLTHVPSKRKVIRGSVCSQITFFHQKPVTELLLTVALHSCHRCLHHQDYPFWHWACCRLIAARSLDWRLIWVNFKFWPDTF